jgi:hypothetical protein
MLLNAERGLCSSVTAPCPHQSMQTPRRSKPISFNAMTMVYTPSRSTTLEPIFLGARVQRAGASKWPSGWGFMSRCQRLLLQNQSCVASAPGATTFGAKVSRTAPHSKVQALASYSRVMRTTSRCAPCASAASYELTENRGEPKAPRLLGPWRWNGSVLSGVPR